MGDMYLAVSLSICSVIEVTALNGLLIRFRRFIFAYEKQNKIKSSDRVYR